MTSVSKLTSKGQITIPKRVRERLGLRLGDEIEFVDDDGAIRLRKRPGPSPFARYTGYLRELAGQEVDAVVATLRGPGPDDPDASRE